MIIISNSLASFNMPAYIMYNQYPVVLSSSPWAGQGKEFCLVIYDAVRCWLFICAS